MATLTVRNLEDEVVRQLRIRAAEHGRSAEAEHRELLRAALMGGSQQPNRQKQLPVWRRSAPEPLIAHRHRRPNFSRSRARDVSDR